MAGRPNRRRRREQDASRGDGAAGGGGRRSREPRPPPTEEEAWGRLLRWLGMAPRSRSEIARRIGRWGVDEATGARLIGRLERLALVDDEALAHVAARDLGRRGVVGRAAQVRLRSRGLEAELIERAVAQAAPEDETARATELATRRLRQLPSDPVAARRRLASWLLRRGFQQRVVWDVVGKVLAGAADRDDPPDRDGP